MLLTASLLTAYSDEGCLAMQDAANVALEGVVKTFSAAHADAVIVNFPFATIQRGFVTNYGQLGFVNAVSGCASDLAITQYSTGNLYSLADPTFTAEGAKVSRGLSTTVIKCWRNRVRLQTHCSRVARHAYWCCPELPRLSFCALPSPTILPATLFCSQHCLHSCRPPCHCLHS